MNTFDSKLTKALKILSEHIISESNYMYKDKSFAIGVDGPNDNSIVTDELYDTLQDAYPYLVHLKSLDLRTTIFVLDALLNGNQDHAGKILYEKGVRANTKLQEGREWNDYWRTYGTHSRSWEPLGEKPGTTYFTPDIPRPLPKLGITDYDLRQLYIFVKHKRKR